MKLYGHARMIRIHLGEHDQWQGKALHEAIVHEARQHDLAGATVYRGIEGYGASSRIHQQHLLGRTDDLPIVVTIIDEASKIEAFMPVLDGMVSDGLMAISDVEVIRYVHREHSTDATCG
jgi:PII-like signaling protein